MADNTTTDAFAASRAAHEQLVLEAISELGPGPVQDTAIGMHTGQAMYLVTQALARLASQGKVTQAGTYMWRIA